MWELKATEFLLKQKIIILLILYYFYRMIPEINSEVFSILSLQAHYCPIENNKEYSEQLTIFLKTRLNNMLNVSIICLIK